MFALAVTLNTELLELAFVDKFDYTPNCGSYSIELSPSSLSWLLKRRKYNLTAEGQTGKTVCWFSVTSYLHPPSCSILQLMMT